MLFPTCESDPVRAPGAVGLKTTLIEQLLPAGRGRGQLLVTLKSPTIPNPHDSGPAPVLVRVTLCAGLCNPTPNGANVNDSGEKTAVAGIIPLPKRLTGTMGIAALLGTESDPPRPPPAVGVKVTLRVQVASGISAAGQLFVCAKSLIIWMPPIFKRTSPLLVSVTACEALVVLINWSANTSDAGESAPPAPVALPASGITAGDPAKFPPIVKNAENEPCFVGANLTSKLQLAPTAIVIGQWFTTLKGDPDDQSVIWMALVVVLVNVTNRIGLTELIAWLPKSMLAGETSCGTLLPFNKAFTPAVPAMFNPPFVRWSRAE
jgi:hypothetical protein